MNDLPAKTSVEKQDTTSSTFGELESLAFARVQQGLALPREVYAVHLRNRIDWSRFPAWARPTDPEIFDECGHEG